MVVEFDPEKNHANIANRGLPFDLVEQFDWSKVLILEDKRKDYGELRLLVLGLIGARLHSAVVKPRNENLRVVSLR